MPLILSRFHTLKEIFSGKINHEVLKLVYHSYVGVEQIYPTAFKHTVILMGSVLVLDDIGSDSVFSKTHV